jgi:hypothetical protein
MKPQPTAPECCDQYQFEDWEVGTSEVGGHRAIVEHARVSGGIEGARRERQIRVFMELRRGVWVVLEGRTNDDEGFGELLAIAGTIQPL